MEKTQKKCSPSEDRVKRTVPKQHHYVPQMVLRRFTDAQGKLYFFSKNFPDKGVICSSPKSLFRERHLYSVMTADGVDTSLESELARMEHDANQVIEKIVAAARRSAVPRLTTQERELWNLYSYIQWKRVPDFHKEYFSDENFAPVIEEAKADYLRKYGPLTAEMEESFQNPAWLESYKQSVRVGVMSHTGPRVQEILNRKGLGIAFIRKPNKSFVIGSFPIVKFAHAGRSHLTDPTVEVWFPISHDVAVTPAPYPPPEERLVEIQDRHVRAINEAIFKQSTAIAGRSPALISSLSRIS